MPAANEYSRPHLERSTICTNFLLAATSPLIRLRCSCNRMSALLTWLRSWLPGAPWTPLTFPTSGFETLADDVVLEEKGLPEYDRDAYYPVTLGEVFIERYQVVGKLGFGMSSTVWLARDMQCVS